MKALRFLGPLLVMARPHNGLICVLVLVVGLMGPTWAQTDWGALLGYWPSALALFLLCSAAHLVNDLVDLPADRDNRPLRPLVTGSLPSALVRWVALSILLGSFFLGFLSSPHWWPWWLVWTIGGMVYSVGIKGRHPMLAPIWTALVIASCWSAGASLGGMTHREWAILALMMWFLILRELVKGMEDARGDLLAGYLTCHGRFPATRTGVLFLALPLVLVGLFLTMAATSIWTAALSLAFVLTLVGAGVYLFTGAPGWINSAGSLLKWSASLGVGLLLIQKSGL